MSNAEWTKIILAKMQGVLKPRGFRKRGASFARRCDDDVVLVVNLQKSTSSDNTLARMTVNLGVLSLPLARIASSQGQNDSPSVWDCHWRQRLGFLMPVKSDKWWEARNRDEAEQVGEEIAEALSWHGLPSLDGVAATRKLRALWESGCSPGLGEKERAECLAILSDPERWRREQAQRLEEVLARHDARHSD